jgi:hypothetical protein
VRPEFETVVALGQLPTDADLDEDAVRRYAEALDALVAAPSAYEAVALTEVFPPDESTSFGLAWTLVHTIESSPDWPVAAALDDRNYWVTLLRERSL